MGSAGGEGFRLGGQGERKRARVDAMEQGDETISLGVNRQLMNMDYNSEWFPLFAVSMLTACPENFDVSDYATEDTTFKKKVRLATSNRRAMLIPPQKKKVKRSTRKADVGEDEAATGDGDVDMKPAQLNREIDDNLVDDDDLQLALARQRRKATKKVNRVRPEDIATQGECGRRAG